MPIIKSEHDVDPPKDPHLAVMTGVNGTVMAIPPGALMYIVIDPARFDGVHPMVLAKVTERALWFNCACGNAQCTRKMQYTVKVTGWHPYAKDRGAVGTQET